MFNVSALLLDDALEVKNFLASNTGYLVTDHTIHAITYLLSLHHPEI